MWKDRSLAAPSSPKLSSLTINGLPRRAILPTDAVSPIFQATLEATEEAVYNSLVQATKVSNRKVQGVEIEAIPVDRVVQILKKYSLGN